MEPREPTPRFVPRRKRKVNSIDASLDERNYNSVDPPTEEKKYIGMYKILFIFICLLHTSELYFTYFIISFIINLFFPRSHEKRQKDILDKQKANKSRQSTSIDDHEVFIFHIW